MPFGLALLLPAMRPRANGKHRQNRQRSQPKSRVGKRRPRQHHQHGDRAQRNPEPFHQESWCTGEDSNLRSPLGAADLQSAAINHSATCAHAEQKLRPGTANPAIKDPSARNPLTPKLRCRAKRLSRKSILGSCWGSVLSESSATYLACFYRYASWLAQGFNSGAGEGI